MNLVPKLYKWIWTSISDSVSLLLNPEQVCVLTFKVSFALRCVYLGVEEDNLPLKG